MEVPVKRWQKTAALVAGFGTLSTALRFPSTPIPLIKLLLHSNIDFLSSKPYLSNIEIEII
jgi:hypothetical protein